MDRSTIRANKTSYSLDVNVVLIQIEAFDDNCSDPNLEWCAGAPLAEQIKHHRAFMQASQWL